MNFITWFRSLTKPADVFKEEKKNAGLFEAIKNVGVAGLVLGVVCAILIGVVSFLLTGVMMDIGAGEWYEIDIILILIELAAIIILCVILSITGLLIESGFCS